MAKNFKLAGRTFTLKNVRFGIHSEETADFTANLYCDGKRIAFVSNNGQGGATNVYYAPENRDSAREAEEAVRKEIWLTCNNGTVINHSLSTVADECLCQYERHELISKYQKTALVIEKSDDWSGNFHLCQLGAAVKIWVQDYPGTLAKKIAELEDKGWTVVNTNIPTRIYKAAKEWRQTSC